MYWIVQIGFDHVLVRGCDGLECCIDFGLGVMPRLVGRLISDAGSARAPAQLQRVTALLDILRSYGLIPAFKAVMAELDAQEGWSRVRAPLVALRPDERARLRTQLAALALERAID